MSFFSRLFSNNAGSDGQPDLVVASNALEGAGSAGNRQDFGELVAAITAAIAAFEAEGKHESLIVRKISRVTGSSTVWNNAGRADCMRSRRIVM